MSESIARRAKGPTEQVRYWLRYLRFAAKSDYYKPPKEEIVRLAGLLALVGPVFDHTDVLNAFRLLLFKEERTIHWPTALAAIPADPEAIQRIADCVNAYQNLAKKGIDRLHLSLVPVIEVMIQVPDPQVYVSHCIHTGMDHAGGVFHPNTFEEAKRRLRGSMGAIVTKDYTSQRDTVEEIDA